MTTISVYPATISCQIDQFFQYIPVVNPDVQSYSVSPSPATFVTNTTFDASNGIITVNKPYITSTLRTYTVVLTMIPPIVPASYTYTFTMEVVPLKSPIYLQTLTTLPPFAPPFTPAYVTTPPPEYDYSYNLVTTDNTGGLYPVTYTTALPPGLTYSTSTGVFTGTLNYFSIWPLTNYQMHVDNNLYGSSYSYFALSVDNQPVFSYPSSPYILTPGESVSIAPVISGQAVAVIYSVDPSSPGLPADLTVNRSTGLISGVLALNSVGQITVTIVAQTASGSPAGRATANITLSVNKAPDFIYPNSPYILPQGVYTQIVPVSQSATVVPITPGQSNINAWTQGANYPPNPTNYENNFVNTTEPTWVNYTNIVAISSNANTWFMFGNSFTNDTFSFNRSTLQWTNLSLTTGSSRPSRRTNAAMVYNASTNQVLLYGGLDAFSKQCLSDTWLYNVAALQWVLIDNSSLPGPLANSAVACTGTGSAFLFGGTTDWPPSPAVLADPAIMWKFTFLTQTWLMLVTPSFLLNPSDVMLASMTYNPIAQNLVLFGGRDATIPPLIYGDTWTYDVVGGTYWTQLAATAFTPSARSGASLVFNPNTSSATLYGGEDALGAYLNDNLYIYSLSSGSWNWQSSVASPLPSPNLYNNLPMVVDGNNYLIVRDDGTYTTQSPTTLPQPVVAALNPPQDPYSVGNFRPLWATQPIFAYNDLNKEFMYLYVQGSTSSVQYWDVQVETWLFSLTTLKWRKVATTVNPVNALGSVVVYDSFRQVYLLFAGYDNTTVSLLTVYQFQNDNWSLLTTIGTQLPLNMANACAAYDPTSKKVVLVTGLQAGQNTNQTWIYDTIALAWTLVIPTFDGLAPAGRYSASMVYHAQLDVFLLFGGVVEATALVMNDTWTFDLGTSTWTLVSAPAVGSSKPAARQKAYMVYNSAIAKIILWGGLDVNYNWFNDTWELNLAYNGSTTAWRNLQAPTTTVLSSTISGLYLFMMGYNSVQDRVYLIETFPLTQVSTLTLAAVPPTPQIPFAITFTPCVVVPAPKYTATPTLPYGLQLNPSSGVIYGTPTVLQPLRQYQINESNSIGTFTTSLVISVVRPYTGGREFGNCLSAIPDYQMRHKATVLQYNGNQDRLTKNQRWAQLANGVGRLYRRTWASQNISGSNPNVLQLPQQGNNLQCPANPIICQPTSSSDVPGPIMQLCINPNLPPVFNVAQRKYTDNGNKYPQTAWAPGDRGFPVGKAGSGPAVVP